MTNRWLLSAFQDVTYKKSSYGSSIAVLDGLRGLAVIIVLASHTNSFGMSGQGSLGVILFYFLSGYVLSVPFASGTQKKINIASFKRFTINRLLRIVPVYWVIAGLTTLYLNKNLEWYLWNISFVKGWNHFWSVAQEVRFYILFPVVVFILSFIKNKFFKVGILALLIFLAYKYKFTHKVDMLDGRYVHFYIFMFLGGAFACFLVDLFKSWEVVLNGYIKNAFLWLTFLIFLFLFLSSEFVFSNFWSKIFTELPNKYNMNGWTHPVLWLYLFIIFFFSITLYQEGTVYKVLSSYIFRHIGLLSYSIYLIHVIILIQFQKIGFSRETLFWAVFICSYLFSIVSYSFIEKPFLSLKIKNNQ